MPANPKYLTSSKTQRFAKVTAAMVGGLLVTASLHLAAAAHSTPKVVLATAQYSLFMIWAALMFVPYLMKDGWRCWLLFIGLTITFIIVMWLGLPL